MGICIVDTHRTSRERLALPLNSTSRKAHTRKPAATSLLLAALQEREAGASHGIMIQPRFRAYHRELLLTARLTLTTN